MALSMKSFVCREAVMVVAAVMVAAASPSAEGERTITDTGIASEIESELLFDPMVDLNEIRVGVDDGVATLQGRTDSLLEKRRSEKIARMVKGVREVVNLIEVDLPKREKMMVSADVLTALAENPATTRYKLEVAADEDGGITLTGAVDSWRERWLVEQLASAVHGVTSVTNELEVREDRDRPADEIEDSIRQALRWDVNVDAGLIEVEVEGDKAVLTGVVGSAAEESYAQWLAHVPGIVWVDTSGLEVERWARDSDLREPTYIPMPKDEIERAIESALDRDARVPSEKVRVEVDGTTAILRGEVGSVMGKRAAESSARRVVGVRRVENRIRVAPGEVVEEVTLERRVANAMDRNPYLRDNEVRVEVSDGRVTLTGYADNLFERAEAEDVAASVGGVTSIENYMTVRDATVPVFTSPYVDWWIAEDTVIDAPATRDRIITDQTDEELAEEVRDELWWSPFVDSDDVTVMADSGTVTLTGVVDSFGERRAAMENAYEAGALVVRNRLDVETAD